MGNEPGYATHADVKEIAQSVNVLATKLGELVVEFRHINEDAKERDQRHEKEVSDLRSDIKELRSDLAVIQSKVPLFEQSMANWNKIKTTIIGVILTAAIIGGLIGKFTTGIKP